MKQQIKCAHGMPISECREHWVEFCAIVGDTPIERALRWSLSDYTGTSSQTLCAFMLGIKRDAHDMPPFDKSDRARCIKLLRLIPEWLPRLPELAEANPGGMGGEPSEVNNANWSEQIKLILQEGGF